MESVLTEEIELDWSGDDFPLSDTESLPGGDDNVVCDEREDKDIDSTKDANNDDHIDSIEDMQQVGPKPFTGHVRRQRRKSEQEQRKSKWATNYPRHYQPVRSSRSEAPFRDELEGIKARIKSYRSKEQPRSKYGDKFCVGLEVTLERMDAARKEAERIEEVKRKEEAERKARAELIIQNALPKLAQVRRNASSEPPEAERKEEAERKARADRIIQNALPKLAQVRRDASSEPPYRESMSHFPPSNCEEYYPTHPTSESDRARAKGSRFSDVESPVNVVSREMYLKTIDLEAQKKAQLMIKNGQVRGEQAGAVSGPLYLSSPRFWKGKGPASIPWAQVPDGPLTKNQRRRRRKEEENAQKMQALKDDFIEKPLYRQQSGENCASSQPTHLVDSGVPHVPPSNSREYSPTHPTSDRVNTTRFSDVESPVNVVSREIYLKTVELEAQRKAQVIIENTLPKLVDQALAERAVSVNRAVDQAVFGVESKSNFNMSNNPKPLFAKSERLQRAMMLEYEKNGLEGVRNKQIQLQPVLPVDDRAAAQPSTRIKDLTDLGDHTHQFSSKKVSRFSEEKCVSPSILAEMQSFAQEQPVFQNSMAHQGHQGNEISESMVSKETFSIVESELKANMHLTYLAKQRIQKRLAFRYGSNVVDIVQKRLEATTKLEKVKEKLETSLNEQKAVKANAPGETAAVSNPNNPVIPDTPAMLANYTHFAQYDHSTGLTQISNSVSTYHYQSNRKKGNRFYAPKLTNLQAIENQNKARELLTSRQPIPGSLAVLHDMPSGSSEVNQRNVQSSDAKRTEEDRELEELQRENWSAAMEMFTVNHGHTKTGISSDRQPVHLADTEQKCGNISSNRQPTLLMDSRFQQDPYSASGAYSTVVDTYPTAAQLCGRTAISSQRRPNFMDSRVAHDVTVSNRGGYSAPVDTDPKKGEKVTAVSREIDRETEESTTESLGLTENELALREVERLIREEQSRRGQGIEESVTVPQQTSSSAYQVPPGGRISLDSGSTSTNSNREVPYPSFSNREVPHPSSSNREVPCPSSSNRELPYPSFSSREVPYPSFTNGEVSDSGNWLPGLHQGRYNHVEQMYQSHSSTIPSREQMPSDRRSSAHTRDSTNRRGRYSKGERPSRRSSDDRRPYRSGKEKRAGPPRRPAPGPPQTIIHIGRADGSKFLDSDVNMHLISGEHFLGEWRLTPMTSRHVVLATRDLAKVSLIQQRLLAGGYVVGEDAVPRRYSFFVDRTLEAFKAEDIPGVVCTYNIGLGLPKDSLIFEKCRVLGPGGQTRVTIDVLPVAQEYLRRTKYCLVAGSATIKLSPEDNTRTVCEAPPLRL